MLNEPMYDYVIRRLDAARGTWPVVAEKSGVSKRTLEKIFSREIQDPGVSHVQKLYDHFRGVKRRPRRLSRPARRPGTRK